MQNKKPLGERLAELPLNLGRRIDRQIQVAQLIFSNLGMPTSSVQLQIGVLESFQAASNVTSSADEAFELYWWIGIILAQQAYVERFEQCVQVLMGKLAERGQKAPTELVHAVVTDTLDEAARITGQRPSALDMVTEVLPIMMKNAAVAEIFGEEAVASQ